MPSSLSFNTSYQSATISCVIRNFLFSCYVLRTVLDVSVCVNLTLSQCVGLKEELKGQKE